MKQKYIESLTLGIDLGGTKIKIALVDVNGKILLTHKYPTNPEKGSTSIIDDLLKRIDKCLGKTRQEVRNLGIGVAAQIDSKGVVNYAPNLKWRNIPLKEILEKKLSMPVVVLNDVKAATWGEWRYGSGMNVDDLVALFIGTGVGGGVVSGGKMIIGCNNAAGELGHITIVTDGRKCHCPNKGCLEAYAGGWAISERAQETVSTHPEEGTRLISLASSIEKITATTVGQAYHERDKLAYHLIEETGTYLAAGVVGIVNAFNPCILTFGGGVIEGIPELIPSVENTVRKNALESATKNLKIVKASLGDDAGVIGAAYCAQTKIGENL